MASTREMAGDETPHHTSEKQSTSRLLELFSSSRDILYGDEELLSEAPRGYLAVGETSRTEDQGTLLRQPSTPRALDSISRSQEDVSHSEQMEIQPALPTSLVCSNSLSVGEL